MNGKDQDVSSVFHVFIFGWSAKFGSVPAWEHQRRGILSFREKKQNAPPLPEQLVVNGRSAFLNKIPFNNNTSPKIRKTSLVSVRMKGRKRQENKTHFVSPHKPPKSPSR